MDFNDYLDDQREKFEGTDLSEESINKLLEEVSKNGKRQPQKVENKSTKRTSKVVDIAVIRAERESRG